MLLCYCCAPTSLQCKRAYFHACVAQNDIIIFFRSFMFFNKKKYCHFIVIFVPKMKIETWFSSNICLTIPDWKYTFLKSKYIASPMQYFGKTLISTFQIEQNKNVWISYTYFFAFVSNFLIVKVFHDLKPFLQNLTTTAFSLFFVVQHNPIQNAYYTADLYWRE